MGGPNSNNPVKLGELKFKVKYKDLCVASPGLSVRRGIVIAGNKRFRDEISKSFEELINKSKTGKVLVNEIFYLLENKEIVIYEDKNAIVSQADPYLISFNIDIREYDYRNGLGDKSLLRTNSTCLAHELEHIRQRLLKLNLKTKCTDKKPKKGEYINIISYDEVLAVYIENKVRKDLGLQERTHYDGVNVHNKELSDDHVLMEYDERKNKCKILDPRDRFNSEIIKFNVFFLTVLKSNPFIGYVNKQFFDFNYTLGKLKYGKIPGVPKGSEVTIISASKI